MLASATTVMILEQEGNGLSVFAVNGHMMIVLKMLCMILMERKSCSHCVC